jgi:hypothetical protein
MEPECLDGPTTELQKLAAKYNVAQFSSVMEFITIWLAWVKHLLITWYRYWLRTISSTFVAS